MHPHRPDEDETGFLSELDVNTPQQGLQAGARGRRYPAPHYCPRRSTCTEISAALRVRKALDAQKNNQLPLMMPGKRV
jgi:hypothetical protein